MDTTLPSPTAAGENGYPAASPALDGGATPSSECGGGGGSTPFAVAPLVATAAAGDEERGRARADASGGACDDEDAIRAPSLALPAIFARFLSFGLRAFGGPVAQINIMRDELVDRERWVSPSRFKRVYAAYQVIPGPEATELACFFGVLAGGRLGGLVAGLGFILPGFCLMLLFSWFYERYGIANGVFASVFRGLQPAVCAMVFRAAHKIGESVCRHHSSGDLDHRLFLVVWLAALESVLSVNFFVTKAHLTVLYLLLRRGWLVAGGAWAAVFIAGFVAIIATRGPMGQLVPQGVGAAAALGDTPGAQFVIGLLGGLVTFGGAYTAIPFLQYETVVSSGWVSNQLFLDSLAVGALLPTPLVMFITMIGYGAGGWGGAFLMTLGMFLPAFALPILGHHALNRLTDSGSSLLAQALDGLAATTVGLICVTAVQLLRTSIRAPTDAIIFMAALHCLYAVRSQWTPVLIIAAAAMGGFLLYF